MPRRTILIQRSAGAREARSARLRAHRITLRGRVQGLGVRPAISRLASEIGLAGFVANTTLGVEIHIEGPAERLDEFHDRLISSLPAGVRLLQTRVHETAATGQSDFRIQRSIRAASITAQVPPDVAACPHCLNEGANRENRRFGYAFTTCTQCGPRYSLVGAMPYDRQSTGMAGFTQCRDCAGEYKKPTDRRFHSQTNSCSKCGPQFWLADPAGVELSRGDSTLDRAVAALKAGQILALKGAGGYQLLADASSRAAVSDLRQRKQRFGKPLAVLVPDLAAAEQLAVLDRIQRDALADPSNAIVVARLRFPSSLAPEVTAGLSTVGVMLPTTPLHSMLASHFAGPLIATSGNREGEPLSYDEQRATDELCGCADFLLHHNRPILRPIDDSVVQVVAGRQATIRLARGLAPLPLALDCDRPILALGGHQKSAVALCNGAQAVLGPHIGDLETEATRARFLDHVESMCRLYGMKPELLVTDQHPDYFSTRWAAQQSIPKIAVQHHHAHVAAGMLERDWLDREVLGVSWDGTGFGTDGTIWGGEFLCATATTFDRVACLRPFVLPGGEAAVREPWRVAVSLVHQALGPDAAARLRWPAVPPQSVERIVQLLRRPDLFPSTTSAGRLFDGVASLVLGISKSQFEGQPAMLLEAACDDSTVGGFKLPLECGHPVTLDWRPLIATILDDLAAAASGPAVAMKFHRSLAAGILAVCDQFRKLPIVLCGGCFNNCILTELVAEQFDGRFQEIELPGIIPVGDGGLAAGQLAVTVAQMKRFEHSA